jgi:hypothetical protein
MCWSRLRIVEVFSSVLTRIRRIRMLLGLLDQNPLVRVMDPDTLVRDTDPPGDQDPRQSVTGLQH